MKTISFNHLAINKPTTKHEHEYQELCEELQPFYGKGVWTVPYLPFATEFKIREAHKIAVRRGIIKIGYLKGILKKLP